MCCGWEFWLGSSQRRRRRGPQSPPAPDEKSVEMHPSPPLSLCQPVSLNKGQKTDLGPQVTHRHANPGNPGNPGPTRGTSDLIGPGEGWVKAGRRLSDPHRNQGRHVASQHHGMPMSSSTFRGNKHLSTGSPITTPISRAYDLSSGSSRPPCGPPVLSRLPLGSIAKLPNDKRLSLTSSHVAPASPTPSHMRSIPAPPNYLPTTPLVPLPLQVPAATHPDPDITVLKVMDFGFQNGDKRRHMLKEDDSPEDDPFGDDDSAGHYTAVYDFDAARSAETDLNAGDEVRCLGRGGGDGRTVAIRSGLCEVTHALVSEGYCEQVMTRFPLQSGPRRPIESQGSPVITRMRSSHESALTATGLGTSTYNRLIVEGSEPDPSGVESITDDDIQRAKRIGEGGYGVVLVLNHLKVGEVALKRLRMSLQDMHDQKRRVLREGQLWKKLEHPNVLPILGVLLRQDDIFLVSPYARNGSLDMYTLHHPLADRPRLLAGAAAAIAYLHLQGIIHGDIKASNIVVSATEDALLCDFGLSRSQADATSTTGKGAGTLRCQSPELVQVESGPIPSKTFQSDVWAFGMTIYQALSDNIPYHQYTTQYAFLSAIVRGELPETYPTHSQDGRSYQSVWGVAIDCWRKNPAQRASMDDIHGRLKVASTSHA